MGPLDARAKMKKFTFILALLAVTAKADWTIQENGWIGAVAFSPDSRFIAVGDADGTVRLRSTADGWLEGEYKGGSDSITAIAFSPDGQTLTAGGFDNTTRLW